MHRIRAISYSGAGFNGIYHLGATAALSEKIRFQDLHFAGASAGAIAGNVYLQLLQTKRTGYHKESATAKRAFLRLSFFVRIRDFFARIGVLWVYELL